MKVHFFITVMLVIYCFNFKVSMAEVHMPNNLDTQQTNLLTAIKADSTVNIMQAIQSVIVQDKENKSPMCVLLKTIMTDSTEDIKKALQLVINKGKNKKTPLLWAILLNKANAVKTLLDCGAEMDVTLLKYAVKMGDVKVALAIVQSGTNLFTFTVDFLKLAILNTAKDVSSISNMKKGFNPLSLVLIQELITKGYDVNKVWGELFYHIPTTARIIDVLIANHANPNYVFIKHTEGHDSYTTPLIEAIHCSTIWGKEETSLIEKLLTIGADVNMKADAFFEGPSNLRGAHTPLYFAIEFGKTKTIALLLEHGAEIE